MKLFVIHLNQTTFQIRHVFIVDDPFSLFIIENRMAWSKDVEARHETYKTLGEIWWLGHEGMKFKTINLESSFLLESGHYN